MRFICFPNIFLSVKSITSGIFTSRKIVLERQFLISMKLGNYVRTLEINCIQVLQVIYQKTLSERENKLMNIRNIRK